MKLFIAIFLIGIAIASAVPLDTSNKELRQERATHAPDEKEKELSLDEVKKKLKDRMNDFMQKVKDAVKAGQFLRDGAFEKFIDIQKKFKDIGEVIKKNGKDILENVDGKGKDFITKLLDKMGVKDKEEEEDKNPDVLILDSEADFDVGKLKESQRSADIDVFEILEELKREIREKFDIEKIKEFLRKHLGKDSELREQILSLLEESGGTRMKKILEFLDRILEKKESSQRSISDVFHKIKDYFKELHIDLKEKFVKFGEWVKAKYEKGLEKGKTKAENIRRIAKEFLKDTKKIGKDLAEQALEFFREYREELGNIYDDLVDKFNDIRQS